MRLKRLSALSKVHSPEVPEPSQRCFKFTEIWEALGLGFNFFSSLFSFFIIVLGSGNFILYKIYF